MDSRNEWIFTYPTTVYFEPFKVNLVPDVPTNPVGTAVAVAWVVVVGWVVVPAVVVVAVPDFKH